MYIHGRFPVDLPVCVYIYIYICACIHIFMHLYIYAHMYVVYVCVCVHIQACTLVCMRFSHVHVVCYMYIHKKSYAYIHTGIHIHMCIQPHIHMHTSYTYIHTYIHTYTCIHTYIYTYIHHAGCGVPQSIAAIGLSSHSDSDSYNVLVGLRNGRIVIFSCDALDAVLQTPVVRRLGESPVTFCNVLTAVGTAVVAVLEASAYRWVFVAHYT